MNFGFYCNWQLVLHENKYFISSLYLKYIKTASAKFENIYLLTSVRCGCPSIHDVEMDIKNIKIIHIPCFEKYHKAFPFFFLIIYKLKFLAKKVDFLFISLPMPFAWIATMFKKETIINYHYASNPLEAIWVNSSNKIIGFLRYLFFYPEYILISIAAYLNRCSANGSGVLKNIPFYLRGKVKILHESSLSNQILARKKYRKILLRDTVLFLCVSRMYNGKGLFELLDAFHKLKEKHPSYKYQLTLVGDGILIDQLKKYTLVLGLKKYVTFTGFIKNGSDLDKIYSQHDIFIMPSLSEACPRVLIEAMSESLFCISTNVGCVPELLCYGKAGKIINTGCIEEIYEACRWIYKNKSDASKIARISFERSKKFSIENFFEDLLRS